MDRPSDAVRKELEQFLQNDSSKMGDVYRLTRRGLNADQIANELGVNTSGFVSNNRTKANALLEGSIPGGPRIALQVLQGVRRALKTNVSSETRAYLVDLEATLRRLALPADAAQPHRSTKGAEPPIPPARPPGPGELKASIETFMAGYLDARRAPYRGNHPINQSLDRIVEIFSVSEPLLMRPEVQVRGSTGKGNWASIPWIAFLDSRMTTTTREGVYPVLLFREDMSGAYMTVGEGVTNLAQQGRAHLLDELQRTAARIGTYDLADLKDREFTIGGGLDLRSHQSLARDYAAGTFVHKFYPADEIPDDAELALDLEIALDLVDMEVAARELEPAAPIAAQPAPILAQTVPLSAIGATFRAAVDASGLRVAQGHGDRVRALIAALAARPFVILSGMSGSGKTQLALRLGEWFGEGPIGPRTLTVPVRPDWTGPEALFGYQDALRPPLDGRAAWFVPKSLEFMLAAANDSNMPYLLLLDEMNLAHVERYFSDFLSGIESRGPVLPNLIRGDDGEWRLDPGEPDLVPLPRNLLVIGTVNVDETTYQFSPKVLDRATTFEVRTRTEDLLAGAGRPIAITAGEDRLLAGFAQWVLDDSWHLEADTKDLADQLGQLHALLSETDDEFGHRVYYESQRLAAALQRLGVTSSDEALDHVVLLKILPRIHGSRRRAEPVLRKLREFAGGSAESQDEAAQDLVPPRLPMTANKVARMLRAAEINQFVSFTD